ncbi:MAG: hypothetical protein HRT70_08280 [Flavobacteriaceae bacterium]|nr:hypothetical protein [Flavobacteriaceae bacterium]
MNRDDQVLRVFWVALLMSFMVVMVTQLNSCSNAPTTVSTKKSYTFKWNDPEIVGKKSYRWKNMSADIKKNNRAYSDFLVEQIKTSGLLEANIKDMKDFGYKPGMDKIQFWGNLLVETMFWESGWNKDTKYGESFKDGKGQQVVSRGMFQISIESSNDRNRSDCRLKHYSELHDAKKNIWCGVRVFSWYVKDSGVIRGRVNRRWKGAARYFSVYRGTLDYTKTALAALRKAND